MLANLENHVPILKQDEFSFLLQILISSYNAFRDTKQTSEINDFFTVVSTQEGRRCSILNEPSDLETILRKAEESLNNAGNHLIEYLEVFDTKLTIKIIANKTFGNTPKKYQVKLTVANYNADYNGQKEALALLKVLSLISQAQTQRSDLYKTNDLYETIAQVGVRTDRAKIQLFHPVGNGSISIAADLCVDNSKIKVSDLHSRSYFLTSNDALNTVNLFSDLSKELGKKEITLTVSYEMEFPK